MNPTTMRSVIAVLAMAKKALRSSMGTGIHPTLVGSAPGSPAPPPEKKEPKSDANEKGNLPSNADFRPSTRAPTPVCGTNTSHSPPTSPPASHATLNHRPRHDLAPNPHEQQRQRQRGSRQPRERPQAVQPRIIRLNLHAAELDGRHLQRPRADSGPPTDR